jgi:sodium/potassium/calcium exchanger 6
VAGGLGLAPTPPGPVAMDTPDVGASLGTLAVTDSMPFGSPPQPEAGGGDDDDDDGLAGLDYPSTGGLVSKAVFWLELPLTVVRWSSIFSDSSWDDRRRKWFIATPPVAASVLAIEVCGGVAEAWDAKVGSCPWLLFAPLIASPLPFALHKLTRADVPPRSLTILVVSGFVMSIIWLDLLATEVVALIEAAGLLMGISTSILGLTVIAIGNSAGDLVANIAAARGSSAKMAIAACFGSPVLMNLIGLGAALSVRMAVTHGAPIASSIDQKCRIAFLFLFLSLASHLVVFPLGGYRATRKYAGFLFGLYGFFLFLALLSEGGLLGDFLM